MIEILEQERPTLDDFQAFHRWLDAEKGFDQDPFRNVAYLASEVGEVVQALRDYLRAADDHPAEGDPLVAEARCRIGEELADCLAYIVKLANIADIDLQVAYVDKMKRNVSRDWHLVHARGES
jgi:NTP pyrophosphatase (non-canonical NTP hydrolase)